MIRVTVRLPPLMVIFCVRLTLDYDYEITEITCVLKRILHKKKVIFIQLIEYPLPPYCCYSVTK